MAFLPTMDMRGLLRDANDSANLVRRTICEDVVAVHHTPFVTSRRSAEMIVVVINAFAAIPVSLFDWNTFLPFLVLNVCMVVVMVLGKGAAAHKT